MKKSIIVSGYGGQGVMLTGNVLCKAAILDNNYATFFPSYGAEIRGGAAKCQVIISKDYIGSPVVDDVDIFLCYNKIALEKFYRSLNKDGYVFINSSLFNDDHNVTSHLKKIDVKANEIAEGLGNKLAANMVMIGALIKHTNILSKDSIIQVIQEILHEKNKKLIDLNITAFLSGYDS